MTRLLVSVFAMFIGFFSLILGLVMMPFIAIAAFFTGKRLQKQMRQSVYRADPDVIEGEYEEVKNNK